MVKKSVPEPLKILLVEDNENDLLVFDNILKEARVPSEITHCTRVDEALERLHENDLMFDVVVSEYKLPDKSGLDMFIEMCATGTRLPFIIITQPDSNKLINEALNVGVDGYIIKDSHQHNFDLIPSKLSQVVENNNNYLIRNQMENISRNKEEYFQNILDSANDYILVLDKNYNNLFANRKMCDYIKIKYDGKKEIPDFLQFLKIRVNQVFKTEKPLKTEDNFTIKNQAVYIESIFTPIKDENNNITAICIIYRDITKYKRMEEELLEYKKHPKEFKTPINIELEKSNSLLRATLEATADGILVMDNYQNVIRYNQRFMKIFDIPEENGKLKGAKQVLKSFLKQLTDSEDFVALMGEISGYQDAESFEIIETKQNRVIECYSYPQGVDYEIVGRVWSFRDVTDRKRAEEMLRINEEQYRTVFNSATDAFFIIDLNGNIIEANQQASLLFGYSNEELTNFQLKKLIHPQHQKIIGQFNSNLRTIGQYYGESIGICKDRSIINVEFKGNIIDFKGKKHILAIFMNISERKKMEDKLKKYTTQLEEEVKKQTNELIQSEKMVSLGQLVAGVAHEINNPLASLRANSELIRDYILKLKNYIKKVPENQVTFEQLEKMINTNLNGIERIATITKTLKRFSRPDTEGKTFANINQGLKDTLVVVSNQLKHRIEVIEEYGKLPKIKCNIIQLNQVFMNLILNASQAMKDGTIWIRTWSIDGNIYIEIKDNGKGIQNEIINKIFDPFFTTKDMGTGLGLSISYSIIREHKGDISVESQVGRGTKMTIRLPLEVED